MLLATHAGMRKPESLQRLVPILLVNLGQVIIEISINDFAICTEHGPP